MIITIVGTDIREAVFLILKLKCLTQILTEIDGEQSSLLGIDLSRYEWRHQKNFAIFSDFFWANVLWFKIRTIL